MSDYLHCQNYSMTENNWKDEREENDAGELKHNYKKIHLKWVMQFVFNALLDPRHMTIILALARLFQVSLISY